MSEGAGVAALPGMVAPVPKRRGRPPGAKNKRAAGLVGVVEARFGSTPVEQAARLCMVTQAELRAAGGSMARAQVNKAVDLVAHARQAKASLDQDLRDLVLTALAQLVDRMPSAQGRAAERLVDGFIDRIQHLGGELGLPQALKLLADERAALLPYLNQKQPMAVQVENMNGPSVVVMAMEPQGLPMLAPEVTDADFIEVLPAPRGQVTETKSQDQQQSLMLQGVDPPTPAD